MECDVGYYSFGWNQQCTECSYYDRATVESYYETNLIDNSCYEGDVLIETIRNISSGDTATIVIVILCAIVVIGLVVGAGCVMCRK